MAHVVVIGAGLGGVPAALELRKHLPRNHQVTLIGARPYFEFTPSNPWIAVGWRTTEETRITLETPLEKRECAGLSAPSTTSTPSSRRLRSQTAKNLATTMS